MPSSSSSSSSSRAPAPAPLSVALTATAAAGALEPLITYPLEYVKTAQQLHNSIRTSHLQKIPLSSTGIPTLLESTSRNVMQAINSRDVRTTRMSSSIGVIQDVWRRDGIKGFYRGVAIASTGGFAKSTVRMGVYDRLKRNLQASDGSLSGGRALLAGVGAGLAETVVVVVPTETAKTKLVHATLLPRNHTFYAISNSSLTAVRTLHSIGGMRVLYAGLTATLVRQMTAAMTRFGTYQSLKNIVGGSMRPGQKLPSGITFGLGAISGVATVAVTMPFDVVKTRMQSIGARQRYRSTWWCMVQTVQEEGLRTLWRGSTMRLCRLTFSGAVTFFVYEEITSLAGYS